MGITLHASTQLNNKPTAVERAFASDCLDMKLKIYGRIWLDFFIETLQSVTIII